MDFNWGSQTNAPVVFDSSGGITQSFNTAAVMIGFLWYFIWLTLDYKIEHQNYPTRLVG